MCNGEWGEDGRHQRRWVEGGWQRGSPALSVGAGGVAAALARVWGKCGCFFETVPSFFMFTTLSLEVEFSLLRIVFL